MYNGAVVIHAAAVQSDVAASRLCAAYYLFNYLSRFGK